MSVDEENEGSDASVPSMKRGRNQVISARLRISKIEKALARRDDLSIDERRSLRARKNTAKHRERKK